MSSAGTKSNVMGRARYHSCQVIFAPRAHSHPCGPMPLGPTSSEGHPSGKGQQVLWPCWGGGTEDIYYIISNGQALKVSNRGSEGRQSTDPPMT